MNHSLLIAFRAVWFTVIGAEIALSVLLSVRKAYKEYPAFYTFILFSTGRSFLLLSTMMWHSALLQQVRWGIYIPQLAILIAVLLEVLHLLFHPFETLPKNTIVHFVGATSTMILFAIGFAVRNPGAQPTAWATFATSMDQAVSWILCAVFMLVALFATYFGIPWRHRVYGIGLGFLVYLCTDVAVTTAITQLRLPPLSLFRLLDMIAFLASCSIWGYYFLARETARIAPTPEQLEQVRGLVEGFSKLLPTKES
jgi:hypothetical protein